MERHEPYRLGACDGCGQKCAQGKAPVTEPPENQELQCHPFPPPHSRKIVAILTHTVNGMLLQAACHLAYHSGNHPSPGCASKTQDLLPTPFQALRKAEEAFDFALKWNRFELVAKAQLFKGHAYREMEKWDLAYEAYVRAASHPEFAADKSEEGLEALTRFCAEMRYGAKMSEQSRKVIGGGTKKEIARGLLRCGTFGDIGARGRDDAQVSPMSGTLTAQRLKHDKQLHNNLKVVETQEVDDYEDEVAVAVGLEKGIIQDYHGQGDGFGDEQDGDGTPGDLAPVP
ncbi:hypothetical protein BR93DRAFT_972463 [Coniochaeta sp. PMI_546]|nr:hypothetical protein BR93DRAFT_972463 [Coniochaeta sp. PMI_546]